MKVNVNFQNGSDYWQQKVLDSADIAGRALSDPGLLDQIRNYPPPFLSTTQTPGQVADRLAQTDQVTITVAFYWNPFGKAIAKEESGLVKFNTAKERSGAGCPGDVAHETMHALGYTHADGNSPDQTEGTVPRVIGDMVDDWDDA